MIEGEAFSSQSLSVRALGGTREPGRSPFVFYSNRVPPHPDDSDSLCRIIPSGIDALTVQTRGAEVRLLWFRKDDEVDLEFCLGRHLVIFFPDGILGEVEWSDQAGSERIPASPPETIVSNPSNEYLRLRVRKIKFEFQALLLLIDPALLNNLHEGSARGPSLFDLERKIHLQVEEAIKALRKISDEVRCPGSYTATYVHALIVLAVAALMRSAASDGIPHRPTCTKGGLPSWRLKRALELLECSLSRAPTLADLARPLKLHPTSFCRAFKESTGLTPHRYLLLCRVKRAKEMMRNPDQTLTQIAMDCGFNSSSQFSVVFKRIEGISPRSFRRSI